MLELDYLVRNGTVIDGTGQRSGFVADVGIAGDRIAAVGDLGAAQAKRLLDARGRVVAPGFIDPHVHSEITLLGGRDQMAALSQGVTTQLLSPDGFGWAPLDRSKGHAMWQYTQFAYGDSSRAPDWATAESYLETFEGHIPANVYPQVPHGAVRLRSVGWSPRQATDSELAEMGDTIVEWMEAGAGALSLGLDYQPGLHADLRELVYCAQIAARYGGIYAAHIRSRALGRRDAWRETVEVARQSGTPVHISHERVDLESENALELADREGIDLTFDSYLYRAGMTHLAILLPLGLQAGGLEGTLLRMRDPEARQQALSRLRVEIGIAGDQTIGYTASGRFVGMTLADAARTSGQSLEEFAYDLILEERGRETVIMPWLVGEAEAEETIRRTAAHPRMMIASDGIYDIPHPHPRGYGCYARVLRRFVRELGMLSLEQAVYKMSGYPAQRFGLSDRGQIVAGKAADLVEFDPATVTDRSTWASPLRKADGVGWVMVNGEIVLEAGCPTGVTPGRVLRHNSV